MLPQIIDLSEVKYACFNPYYDFKGVKVGDTKVCNLMYRDELRSFYGRDVEDFKKFLNKYCSRRKLSKINENIFMILSLVDDVKFGYPEPEKVVACSFLYDGKLNNLSGEDAEDFKKCLDRYCELKASGILDCQLIYEKA